MNKYFNYNPQTGELTHKVRTIDMFKDERAMKIWNTKYSGKPTGCLNPEGYLIVAVNDTTYKAHRIIWNIMTGSDPIGQIDHIDGNRANNQWSNLRDVSHADNGRNVKKPITNKSGHVGVIWDKSKSKWMAYITYNRKRKHLGRFDNINDAITARKLAEQQYGFHANHGR